jgi:hypothetical protein
MCWRNATFPWSGWSGHWPTRKLKLPDPTDATLERRYRKIPEHENRVLRVVVNTMVAPERVVSVYFDRTMKGKL